MKTWSWVPLFYLLSFRLVNVPFPKKHLIIVLEWQWVCGGGRGRGAGQRVDLHPQSNRQDFT